MTPRFSILTLLGITAYVGLAVASFIDVYSVVGQLSIYAYLGLLTFAGIVAASEGATTKQGRFAWAFFALSIAYAIVEAGPGQLLMGNSWLDLPHSHLVDFVAGPEISMQVTSEIEDGPMLQREVERHDVRILASMHCSLAFGLLGGCLAIWRYRVLERRANKEKME